MIAAMRRGSMTVLHSRWVPRSVARRRAVFKGIPAGEGWNAREDMQGACTQGGYIGSAFRNWLDTGASHVDARG